METQHRTDGTRHWVHKESLFRGRRVSVEADGKAVEMQSGDGCTNTLKVYFTPLNCPLNVINEVNFMSCVFHHNKKLRYFCIIRPNTVSNQTH